MIKVEFSPDEARVLLGLLDVAVKAAGLQVAESAVVLAKRVSEAGEAYNRSLPQPGASGTTELPGTPGMQTPPPTDKD